MLQGKSCGKEKRSNSRWRPSQREVCNDADAKTGYAK